MRRYAGCQDRLRKTQELDPPARVLPEALQAFVEALEIPEEASRTSRRLNPSQLYRANAVAQDTKDLDPLHGPELTINRGAGIARSDCHQAPPTSSLLLRGAFPYLPNLHCWPIYGRRGLSALNYWQKNSLIDPPRHSDYEKSPPPLMSSQAWLLRKGGNRALCYEGQTHGNCAADF